MNLINSEIPQIVFKLEEKDFSILSQNVTAIIRTPCITEIPGSPNHVDGIIKHRDAIYKIINLRSLVGLKTIDEEIKEFHELMDLRKQDHLNWLNTLEKSVKEDTDFNLTTDPHQCAFGKWYDKFETSDVAMKNLLEKFDVPHKKIHEIGEKVNLLKKDDKLSEAQNIIENTKANELSVMINLFEQIKKDYVNSKKGVLILIENEKQKCGFTVDQVISVEKIYDIEMEEESSKISGIKNNAVIKGLGKNQEDNIIVQFDDERLMKNELYN